MDVKPAADPASPSTQSQTAPKAIEAHTLETAMTAKPATVQNPPQVAEGTDQGAKAAPASSSPQGQTPPAVQPDTPGSDAVQTGSEVSPSPEAGLQDTPQGGVVTSETEPTATAQTQQSSETGTRVNPAPGDAVASTQAPVQAPIAQKTDAPKARDLQTASAAKPDTTSPTPAPQDGPEAVPQGQGQAQGQPQAQAQPQPSSQTPTTEPQPAPTAQAQAGSEDALAAPGQQARARQDKSAKPAETVQSAQPSARSSTEGSAASTQAAAPTAPQSSLPTALQSLLNAEALNAVSTDSLIQTTGETLIDPSLDFDAELGLIRQDTRAEALRPAAQNAALARFTPQTTQTLAAQIARKFSDGARVFDIRLDPPELGRVDVRLELGPDKRVSAILSAERTETLAELQRSARDLERALQEAGLDLSEDGLSFNLSDGSNPFEDSEGYEAFAPETERELTLAVETPVTSDAPAEALYGFAVSQRTGLNLMA